MKRSPTDIPVKFRPFSPRSVPTITAIRIGFITIAVAGTKIFAPDRSIPAVWVWLPLCLSSSLVAFASAHSWQLRQREQRPTLMEGECRSAALGIDVAP